MHVSPSGTRVVVYAVAGLWLTAEGRARDRRARRRQACEPMSRAVPIACERVPRERQSRRGITMLAAGGSKCLVTGGAGFIGSHLVERLVALGHCVRVVDNLSTGDEANLAGVENDIEFLRGDLCEVEVCRRAVAGIEVVFHVAALPSVPRSLKDPWGSHAANVNATMRLLEACLEAKVARIVYSSSSSVYGDTPVLPKTESVEPLPRSPYAASKLAGEQY